MSKRIPIYQHIVNHIGVAVAGKFAPLASIFIYSRFMTVEDYGVLNLFVSYLWIFAIVMSMNMHVAIGRYIYIENAEIDSFLTTSLTAIGFIYLITGTVVLFNLERFSMLLRLPSQVVILMLLVVLGQIAESLFTQVAIFNERSSYLLKIVSIKALCAFFLSIGLLNTMNNEIYLAVLYSDAITSLAILIYVLRSLLVSIRWSFKVSHMRYIVNYAVRLIPYLLCLTLLSQFDRVMIDNYFGTQATGLYSLAYNIGILLPLVVTAVLNTFNPTFFDALNKKDYVRVVKDSENIFALAVMATGILVLFGQELACIFIPVKYYSSFDLIPIVAIGGLCSVIFQIWVRVIYYANRIFLISFVAIIATAANIVLNYWLLPIVGYKIAAFTTVIAYLVMSLGCVAILNYVICLFKVSVLAEMIYVVGLAAMTIFFQNLDLQLLPTITLKSIILVFLVWHLKAKLFALVESKKVVLNS